MTLVLYYHQLSDEHSPLCVPPDLFSAHLSVLAAVDARVLTAGELADALADGDVPDRSVVITFDDGFAAAVSEARARLDRAGFRATFFCVAGHLGGANDWATQPRGAPVAALARADELASLVRAGHEIGAHGWSHAPLDRPADLQRELVEARSVLAEATGAAVRTFAYPYGARPSPAARKVVQQTYDAAFGTSAERVRSASPRWELPRVDAHYLRDPRLLGRAVRGSIGGYLGARRIAARTRRAFRRDYRFEQSTRR